MKHFALFFALSCAALSQGFTDTTLTFIYTGNTATVSISVPAYYVNAMTVEYGFNWKTELKRKVTAVLADPLKEKYTRHFRSRMLAGADTVKSYPEFMELKRNAAGFEKTVQKDLLPAISTAGYEVLE